MGFVSINEKALDLLKTGKIAEWNKLIDNIAKEHPGQKIKIKEKLISDIRCIEKNINFKNVEFEDCVISDCSLRADFSKTSFLSCTISSNLFVNCSFNGAVFSDTDIEKPTTFVMNEYSSCISEGIEASNVVKLRFWKDLENSSVSIDSFADIDTFDNFGHAQEILNKADVQKGSRGFFSKIIYRAGGFGSLIALLLDN